MRVGVAMKAVMVAASACMLRAFAGAAAVQPSPVLIIAGNFSLNGERVNMAQYDASSGVWTNSYQPVLYLYGEANGVVWDTSVNKSHPYDSLYVVGSFDTISQTSQSQYCGIGLWQNNQLNKVGEGLCSHSDSSAHLQVLTSTVSQEGDLFVGGTFTTRVWDGKKFVGIYNLARFHAATQRWLPLDGQLDCVWCVSAVYSLAWDETQQVLYIAGMFDMLDGQWIPAGLAMWDATNGLQPFAGGGLSMDLPDQDGIGISIAWEPHSQSLFVAGYFTNVNREPCNNIAVWSRAHNSWTCLYDRRYGIAGVTALLLDKGMLYVAGYAASDSSWSGFEKQSPYAIARGNVTQYLEHDRQISATSKLKTSSNTSTHASTNKPTAPRSVQPQASTPRLYPSHLKPAQFTAFWKAQHIQRRRSKVATAVTALGEGDASRLQEQSQKAETPWEWLPSFTGGNGPILSVSPTKLNKRPSLFIAGAFNNYPPVIIWEQESSGAGVVTGIGGGLELSGLVTSVARMNARPIGPAPSPAPPLPPSTFGEGYAAILLVVCIIVGVVIGVFVAASCHSRGYQKIPNSSSDGISLKTLTLSLGETDMDFKECFERAMTARHLPTHEALMMIDPDEIVLNRIIGEGSFGRVWSGHWRSNAVAVKEFVFAQAAIAGGSVQRDSIVEEIVGEAGIMSCLRHPKILQLYGCSVTVQAIWIVSELCSRGSLRMVLNDASVLLSVKARFQMAIDVADAMLYLHTRSPPIIHRDLKSQNIFLHESSPGSFVAKLGDWGSARAVALSGQRTMTHGIGTACWLAPEVIEHAQASKASDVYAFGIVLWEIYTREEVHEGLSAAQIILKVAHEGLRPRVPRECPWKDTMRECWAQQPPHRPTFRVVLSSLSRTFEEFQRQRSPASEPETKSFGVDHV